MSKEIIIFIMKSGLIFSLMFCFYQVFLRKETFFTFNRFFLLFSLIISLLLPFVNFSAQVETVRNINQFQFVGESINEIATEISNSKQSNNKALDGCK